MPIPLPNLDDRSYADLTAQARALLPALDPAWTNYNPSDPGITLVELLAWLTEMLLFQVNQVTPASTEKFLELLNGPDWRRPPDESLDAAIRQTILALRERYRSVTADDYEWLALNAWPQTPEAGRLPGGGRLARVHCVPRRDLSAADPAARRAAAPAHVSLVVLPAADGGSALHDALWQFFDERRTLTTRHHVTGRLRAGRDRGQPGPAPRRAPVAGAGRREAGAGGLLRSPDRRPRPNGLALRPGGLRVRGLVGA